VKYTTQPRGRLAEPGRPSPSSSRLAALGLVALLGSPALASEGAPGADDGAAVATTSADGVAVVATAAADDPDPAARPDAASDRAQGDAPRGRPGLALFGQLRLNGRFDLAYERYGYTDNPTDGKDAFRNYHRFLFLSRHVRDDPFFFTAELLGLTFYEIGYRVRGAPETPWRFSFAIGRVLVPFGSEPLYHHAYGGRVGADHRFLPMIWGEYGAKASFSYPIDEVSLRADFFLVRGLALRQADQVLSIQSHVSPLDDLKFAAGGRLAVSWGPASLYYSIYGGGIGFDRSIIMQALDLTIWRIPGVPVLEDLALTIGVVRADMFGGDQPSSYHFADYIQLRYYPTRFLYIQYRGGMETRDNRAGLFVDKDRRTQLDGTAHSLAVGYIHGGFSLVLQHLWQLELRDEQPDDLLRLTATYEF